VEFYDREMHRDFHFTDNYLYDKACLSKIYNAVIRLIAAKKLTDESGTLFSCPPSEGNPAMIFYRPHETWTSRADWRTQLPYGEDISGMFISHAFIRQLTPQKPSP
jgi:chromosome transmission fidelity protein 4